MDYRAQAAAPSAGDSQSAEVAIDFPMADSSALLAGHR